MLDSYSVLIVGTLAPFCACNLPLKAENDDFLHPEDSELNGNGKMAQPIPQTA